MENNLVKRYEVIKSKKEELDKKITQEEAAFNTLKDKYKEDLTSFCKKHSVKSLEEGKELLAKQEKELQEQISKAEQILKVYDTQSDDTTINLDI